MTKRLVPLLVALTCLLGGCGKDDADYTPKEAATLFAEIAAMPGVTEVHLEEYGPSGIGEHRSAYQGYVQVDDAADPLQVLDRVLAILWQGIPGADLSSVRVHQGDALYDAAYVGLGDPLLTKRYGSQPGTGEPPADQPPLRKYVP
jgi:hypothetical protein